MAEGPKPKQFHPNTFDDGAVAEAIVELDASAKLPAVDGSQLTGISASADFNKVMTFLDASIVVDNSGNVMQRL